MNSEKEEVIAVLESLAPLDNFYIVKLSQFVGSGLIHYFDAHGTSWTFMEDDDSFVARCLEYLRDYGVPEFNDISVAKEYEENRLKDKTKHESK